MVTKENIEIAVNEWINGSEAFLVEVKSAPGKVAVYIDKPDGITLDECASLNKFISGRFDSDPIWETTELEVSSPGMDQPLKVYQQFKRRVGREVRVVTSQGKVIRGRLQAADQEGIELIESVQVRENKKKTVQQVTHHFGYPALKETKLILSFKN